MAWCDDAQVALVDEFEKFRAGYRKQKSRAASVDRAQVNALMDGLQQAWLARETVKARAAFHVDFGADAGNDLWEHHLGTLRLDRKYRVPAWASRLFEAVVTAGIPVEGRTVGDLTAAYTSHVSSTGDVIDVGEYADLVPVPAKEQNQ